MRAGQHVSERLRGDDRTSLITHIGSATVVIKKSQHNSFTVANASGDPTHSVLLQSALDQLLDDPFLLSALKVMEDRPLVIRFDTIPEFLDSDEIFLESKGVSIVENAISIRVPLKNQLLSSAPQFPHIKFKRGGLTIDANPVAVAADLKIGPFHIGAMRSPFGPRYDGYAYDMNLKEKNLQNARNRVLLNQLERQADSVASKSDTLNK